MNTGKKRTIWKYGSLLLLALATLTLMQSCMADIRTTLIKVEGIQPRHVERGKALLESSWQQHGLDQLDRHQTYSVLCTDIWRGMMGRMGTPWPEAESSMLFRFEIGTFDSQVTFLDGKREGVTAGLQSWNYYELEGDEQAEKRPMNKRIRFGLSAYQYFFEMLDRLRQAPIISWAGTETFEGQTYDIVFVTWDTAEPHMEHDQYKLLINQETQLLDYAIYSVRENFLKMPGGRSFYGSIRFEDYRNIDGVLIPHTQTVFLNDPLKKGKKPLHRLTVSAFRFDDFDRSVLQPFTDVTPTGDSKEQG